MKTLLLASLALVFASSRAFSQQAAPQPNPSPAMDKLHQAADGVPAGQVYDNAAGKQDVSVSTDPVADDDLIIATPVVKVKPKEVVFSQWAAGEGGKIGAKWGGVGGFVGGALATGLLAGLGVLPFGWALLIGIGILAAGIAGGYFLGKHLGEKKAKELQGN